MRDGWRWRDDQEKQMVAYQLMWLVNPHLKTKVGFEKLYHPMLGEDELKRRKAEEHRAIIRDRRRKQRGKR